MWYFAQSYSDIINLGEKNESVNNFSKTLIIY